jgi:hypothetical protein
MRYQIIIMDFGITDNEFHNITIKVEYTLSLIH